MRGGELKESATLGQIYHKFQQLGPGKEGEVRAWVREMQNELMAKVERGEDIDGNAVRLANLMTDLYNKAEVMAQLFWEKFPQPSYLRTIGTEIKVSMQYHDLTLEGTIDKLLENEQDGAVWIRDHKSSGRPLAVLFGGLAWSLQARLYRVLATHFVSEPGSELQPIRGFIFDGILKPGIKLCKTDDKNAKEWNVPVQEAYLRRVREWYATYKAEKDKEAMLSRGIIFNEPLFPDELLRVFSIMRALIARPVKPECFWRDLTRQACFQYEKQCIYHDLCESPEWKWDELFENKYKIEEPKLEEENEEADL